MADFLFDFKRGSGLGTVHPPGTFVLRCGAVSGTFSQSPFQQIRSVCKILILLCKKKKNNDCGTFEEQQGLSAEGGAPALIELTYLPEFTTKVTSHSHEQEDQRYQPAAPAAVLPADDPDLGPACRQLKV